MRICFVPIDNRPVCYNLVSEIASIDGNIEVVLPPRDFLGDLSKYADIEGLYNWLESLSNIDCMVLSLDTLAYGGLIPSRRCNDSFEEIKQRINRLKPLLKDKKVLACSSSMGISNNNFNEEEKEYWKDYGKKIFKYSYNIHKNGFCDNIQIPEDVIEDYLNTRERNFKINKMYLKWQEEGLFDTLIFSKDDCAEHGFNVLEAQELEKLGGKTKTGADEIPLTLFARAIKKDIKVFPKFTEPEHRNKVSNYEDISIEKSVIGQLELSGFKIAEKEESADILLIINNFINKQGELVMGWDTQPFYGNFNFPAKPFAIADVRYANGADNAFMKEFFKNSYTENFYGYSGWNTSANSLGSLLAGIKIKYEAVNYNISAFKKLQWIRILDDWAYQANVRKQISYPENIKELMKPYEDTVSKFLDFNLKTEYLYPWKRKFEIELKTQ